MCDKQSLEVEISAVGKTARAYTEFLYERLATSEEEAVGYLNAALEEGDLNVFLLALRDVAEARHGRNKTPTHLKPEAFSELLTENGNSVFSGLAALLEALGMQLTVSLKSAAYVTVTGTLRH